MAEITIDIINKEEYNNGSYPEVTHIKWRIGELDDNILKNFPNLSHLNCDDNQITNLRPLKYCTRLTNLNCNDNQITDLTPLQHCTGLTVINCSKNQIRDLSPLQYCTRLIYLNCYDNRIIDLSPLKYCTGLTKLYCGYNLIADLSPLQYCSGLTVLYCSDNQLTDLSPLQHCIGLIYLNCWNNQITSLESLVYLRNLTHLYKNNNPLNPPSIQVTRFLERIVRNRSNYNNNSIYNDTQNVHDVKVQQSVMDSVRNLMKDKLPNNEEITLDINSVLNSELQEHTKSRLLEYFEETDYHVILLITYKELFAYVWNRIINNPNRLELLKILDDNIQDSECKCFTGRFNRTLSTLVGFYDDIEINISDNSRISAIILQIKDTIIPYDSDKHKELAQTSLIDAGYDSEIIELWISAIQ